MVTPQSQARQLGCPLHAATGQAHCKENHQSRRYLCMPQLAKRTAKKTTNRVVICASVHLKHDRVSYPLCSVIGNNVTCTNDAPARIGA